MSDIRSRAKNAFTKPVSTINFEVVRDIAFRGFYVKINWDYDVNEFPDVVAFKVYKAVMPKPKLKKDYVISQKTLEKTSAIKSNPSNSQLYNKSVFSQNSKVKFEISNSSQHDKTEGNLSEYSFSSVSVLRANKNSKLYSFADRNVKFGESYMYYVTALSNNFKETNPSPILVNVESLAPPNPPAYFSVTQTDIGLLLIFGSTKSNDVSKFRVYKREDSEPFFQELIEMDAGGDMQHFIDSEIFPKKNYVYRVYSEDIFGNISLVGNEKTGMFTLFPSTTTNLEFQPSIQIDKFEGSDFVRIRVRNERPDKVSSVRIERRDDWLFEQKFEIKSYDDKPWPNNHFFNENQVVDFIDRTTSVGRVYSYRVTAFNKVGIPVSYFVTSPMTVGEIKGVLNVQSPKFVQPKIISFDIEPVNSKQNPVFVKCSWKLSGNWSYLLIDTGDGEVRIDNLHSEVFLNNFKPGRRYELSVKLFGPDNKQYDEYRNMIINL